MYYRPFGYYGLGRYPRSYLGAGIGYPYGALAMPYWGVGYPGWGYGYWGYPYAW